MPSAFLLRLTLAASIAHASVFVPGNSPTYGQDFAGGDYNVTLWHTPPSQSAGHYEAAALRCQALCAADPHCCTWTYCTPEGGSSDPERCCLKDHTPKLMPAATHWAGSARTTCPPPPPPPPVPVPWRITNSPPCLSAPNWHDIAGALFFKGVYHVFQGCAAYGGVPAGWHHATSTNLVDWQNHGIEPGLSALPEPYGTSSPCSGFVTVDDEGVPCAGFRECGGQWPGRSNVQVPLELRCARNDNLTAWGPPEYIFWFYFNRGLPYDPVRPWQETISADACNHTSTPCAGGGAEYLYSSPALHGAGAKWTLLGPMFTSNYTVLTPYNPAMVVAEEFVTAGYFGALAGDPRGGATRCLTNNGWKLGANTQYYCGTQAAGMPLVVDFSDPHAVGLLDWGTTGPIPGTSATGLAALQEIGGSSWTMARTLSPSSPNQVLHPGRKIITAWLEVEPVHAQALPRDLSMDPASGALLQQFVPELQALRTGSGSPAGLRALQFEVVADFAVLSHDAPPFGLTLYASEDGAYAQSVAVDLGLQLALVGGHGGPLLWDASTPNAVHVHVIADNGIVSVIVNNRTAVTRNFYPVPRYADRITLFGVDGVGVTCAWQAWALRNATIIDL